MDFFDFSLIVCIFLYPFAESHCSRSHTCFEDRDLVLRSGGVWIRQSGKSDLRASRKVAFISLES